MQPSLAVSTPWSRHLTVVDADECTCICPALFETTSTNPEGPSAPVVMKLYATSDDGECDPQAPVVGTVTMITEWDGSVSVSYNVEDGYALLETNVHVGEERLPVGAAGEFLPASEFPYSGSLATSYKIDPLVCDFYLAAHAKVCGDFPTPPSPAPSAGPTNHPTVSASPSVRSVPTQQPTVTPAPTGGSAFGDPHIKTWGGKEFDYHGGCDLVMLDNPDFHDGVGMTIHIRTKIVTWWSYIETAVIRIGNETIEVSGGDQQQYFVNGVEGDYSVKDFLFSQLGLKVNLKHATKKQLRVRIDLLNADALAFEVYKDFVRVNVKMKDMKWKKFSGSVGLMGRYPHGETVGRDGKTIFTDMNAFGQEWQVREWESKLFRTVSAPQHPTKCSMPLVVPTEEEAREEAREARRRLGESVISREAAEVACAAAPANSRKDCVFDVLAVQNLDMAGSY